MSMMRREKIELYRVRDFGDRINTTFEFIKQNGKQIGKNFLRLLPFLVIGSVISAYLQGSNLDNSVYGSYSGVAAESILLKSMFSLLVAIALSVILFIASLFVYSFVAEYEESEDGTVVDSDVWARVKDVFWGSFGGGMLVGLAVVLGFICCVIPGIWLAVSFSLFFIIYIIERKKEIPSGVTDCMSESYDLVKSNWFPSFGYLLVMGIIGYLLYAALSLPSIVSALLLPFIPDGSIITMLIMTLLYSFVSILSYIGSLFLSVLINVSTSVLYFDLKEGAEGLSLKKKIDKIGQPES